MTTRKNTVRGMTIVELLLALALLSGLVFASVSWTTATARTHAVEGGRASWEAGAARALDVLDDAVFVEDRRLQGNGRERWRVDATADSISVRTRELVTAPNGTLLVSSRLRVLVTRGNLYAVYLDDNDRELLTRPLLGETESLEVSIIELDRRELEITVTLLGVHGASAVRSWRLPKEAVR